MGILVLNLFYLDLRTVLKKMKFSIFFSKCDQICSFLQIWLHLLKKSLNENFIFLWLEISRFRENVWAWQDEVFIWGVCLSS